MPPLPTPGETPESPINPPESLNQVYIPTFGERLELFGLHTRILCAEAGKALKRLFLRVNPAEIASPLAPEKPLTDLKAQANSPLELGVLKDPFAVTQSPENNFEDRNIETLEQLGKRLPILNLIIQACKAFYKASSETDQHLPSDSGLPFRAAPNFSMVQTKENKKKQKQKKIENRQKQRVHIESIAKTFPDTYFDKTIARDSVETIQICKPSSLLAIALYFGMANPGFFEDKEDPGGTTPRFIHEDDGVLKKLPPQQVEPHIAKGLMLAVRKAFAQRYLKDSLYEGLPLQGDITSILVKDSELGNGLRVLNDSSKTKVVILGSESSGKSTIATKLTELLNGVFLEMNSPNKIDLSLRKLSKENNGPPYILEAPAHLRRGKNKVGKIETIVSKILKLANTDSEVSRIIKERFFEGFRGNTTLHLSLLAIKGIRAAVLPARPESIAEIFQGIHQIKPNDIDTINLIKKVFSCLPDEFSSAILSILITNVPQVLLMVPITPPDKGKEKSYIHNSLEKAQLDYLEGTNDSLAIDTKVLPEDNIFRILIERIGREFPADTTTKSILIALLAQLSILDILAETDPLP